MTIDRIVTKIVSDKDKDDVQLLFDLSNNYKLPRMIQLTLYHEMKHRPMDDWLLKQPLIE
jgi:hypothetical protein